MLKVEKESAAATQLLREVARNSFDAGYAACEAHYEAALKAVRAKRQLGLHAPAVGRPPQFDPATIAAVRAEIEAGTDRQAVAAKYGFSRTQLRGIIGRFRPADKVGPLAPPEPVSPPSPPPPPVPPLEPAPRAPRVARTAPQKTHPAPPASPTAPAPLLAHGHVAWTIQKLIDFLRADMGRAVTRDTGARAWMLDGHLTSTERLLEIANNHRATRGWGTAKLRSL